MRRRSYLTRAGTAVACGTLLGCLGRARSGDTGSVELSGDWLEEARDRGVPVLDFEDEAWSPVRGRVDRIEDPAGDGHLLELESGTDVSASAAERRFDAPRDLSGRAFSLAGRWEAPADGWYHYILELRDRSGDRIQYTQTVQTDHLRERHRIDLGFHSTVGEPDLTEVVSVAVGTWVGEQASRVVVDHVRSTPTADTGYVVFTFDDVPESTYTIARPAMEEHGFAGCGAVIKEWVGTSAAMSMQQLDELADDGWEFCSHPQYDDRPTTAMSREELRGTLVEYKQWLLDHGFDRGADTIIYPYGLVDDEALDVVADFHRLGFTLHRAGYGPRISAPLLAGRVDGDDPEAVQRAVDHAAEYGLLVPIMYHGIDEGDRVSATAFEQTVAHVAEVSNVEVVTPGEYLANLARGAL